MTALKLALFGLHRGSSADPDTLVRRAQRAEEIGLESFWVGDHVALPVGPGEQSRGAAAPRGRGRPGLHGGRDAPRAAGDRRDRAAAAAARAAGQAAVHDRLPLQGAADRRHRRRLPRAGASSARRVPGRSRRADRRAPGRDARALGSAHPVLRGALRLLRGGHRATAAGPAAASAHRDRRALAGGAPPRRHVGQRLARLGAGPRGDGARTCGSSGRPRTGSSGRPGSASSRSPSRRAASPTSTRRAATRRSACIGWPSSRTRWTAPPWTS